MQINKKSKPTETPVTLRPPEDAGEIGAAVARIVAGGAAVTLFATRNQTAIGVRFMWGGFADTEYKAHWDEVTIVLQSLASQVEEMKEAPAEEVKGKRRETVTRTSE